MFQPHKGHVFEVPITVVKPEPIQTIPRPRLERAGILFRPGDIVRSFVQVPDGATWATIRVYSNEQVRTYITKRLQNDVKFSKPRFVS